MTTSAKSVPLKADAGFEPRDDQPIAITEAALSAIEKAIKQEGRPGDGLRVAIAGGGCAGYHYNLDFETAGRDDDVVLEFEQLRVFVDSVSAWYLRGTIIDYVTSDDLSGFKFKNPNVKLRFCGCSSAD